MLLLFFVHVTVTGIASDILMLLLLLVIVMVIVSVSVIVMFIVAVYC